MTPDKPSDPQKGKPAEAEKAEVEATEAAQAMAEEAAGAAQPEAKPKRTRKKKAEPEAASAAEGGRGDERGEAVQAAEETGVDKAAAEATEEKPKTRRPRPAKEDRNPEGTKPEGAEKTPQAKAAADEEATKAAEEQAGKKVDRRKAAEPGVLVRAQARYVRTSARKARLVCAHIRGKDVNEARAILAYTPRAAAKPWLKLLESAIANAEHNHELVGEDLRIAAVHADEGPTLKRFRPRAMGRATRIRKRTSHLTIALTPKE
jgi:ribosomal protein L22